MPEEKNGTPEQDIIENETAGAPDTESSAGGEAPDGGAVPSVEELQEALAEARAQADGNWQQVLRGQAEIDNLRKRHERDLEGARKFALDTFVNELLQVRDSLELGLQASQEGSADVAKLAEGTGLTLKLLSDVMSKFGVEQVDPQGEPFNPELHQAMSTQPRDDVPPNTVVMVMQKGYTLNGRLVRPALVMVSQAAGQGAGGATA